MRSDVVVFPASMCAMMPMLRTRERSIALFRLGARKVSEGLVGLCHFEHIFFLLHRTSLFGRGVQEFEREPLRHSTTFSVARGSDEPADRERDLAFCGDFDWHLVHGASDSAGTHLE